jgi:hypothetical protein
MIHTVDGRNNVAVSVASFAEAVKVSDEYLDKLPRYSVRDIAILESSAEVNQAMPHDDKVFTFPKLIAQMRIAK